MIVLSSNKMMNINHGNNSLHYSRISPKNIYNKIPEGPAFPFGRKKGISNKPAIVLSPRLLNYNEENVL